MGLTEAIFASSRGHTIISNADKRYTHEILAPKLLGSHAAVFNSVSMTVAERKGEWRIDGE